MKLEPLYDVHVDLKDPVEVGAGPFGVRRIIDIIGGTVDGPRLKGRVLPSGADWLLVTGDGVSRLSVRATVLTGDGAYIYLDYPGIAVLPPEAGAKFMRGEAIDYGEGYFMTTPRFETGDHRYAWLNAVVVVAEGRLGPGRVEFRAYHVVNG
ncbi:MAG: DUF3237 domain-containing protein [Thermoflexaceae bacterium]|nr:DUF3237 domain-containing protein [Thermoflexaceae bacterium]